MRLTIDQITLHIAAAERHGEIVDPRHPIGKWREQICQQYKITDRDVVCGGA